MRLTFTKTAIMQEMPQGKKSSLSLNLSWIKCAKMITINFPLTDNISVHVCA